MYTGRVLLSTNPRHHILHVTQRTKSLINTEYVNSEEQQDDFASLDEKRLELNDKR